MTYFIEVTVRGGGMRATAISRTYNAHERRQAQAHYDGVDLRMTAARHGFELLDVEITKSLILVDRTVDITIVSETLKLRGEGNEHSQ